MYTFKTNVIIKPEMSGCTLSIQEDRTAGIQKYPPLQQESGNTVLT